MRNRSALTIAFMVLVSIVALLFVADNSKGQQQLGYTSYRLGESTVIYESTESALLGFSSPLTAADNSHSVGSFLDNDIDNDGSYDSMVDPLAGLALGLAVVLMVLGPMALVGERLLLAPCNSLKLLSVWSMVPEQPG